MESLDDLLDFASDIGEEDEDMHNNNNNNKNRTKSLKPLSSFSTGAKTSGIVEEEELEWISNKDAFPKFESFADISPKKFNNNNKQSPVSVLENITNSNTFNSFKVPVRARSKRRREQWQEYSWWWAIRNNTKSNKRANKLMKSGTSSSSSSLVVLERKCHHCQTEKTPQWRAGPTGPKTLCNACGVRYKSGRLVPEYRPASSPTFSTDLHSNSHRKVLEMRKRKQMIEPA